ncbi:single-strand DNA endonuclease ASTE1 [Phascolarctos cinereus]|uniref:Protein asteroid homolog 1 n=1 Tax=Phascolarctos cinereus TaxID=38626 RepID=A0A6P5KD32_PHACI|nr:protein asteroid homolog 1 [Phascolarctos cinereus]XP_020842924.1 protein asteroid homolog 1 [Phascolarctos cinereus]
MGIRGLMSYVEDHSNQFFVDLKLRDTKIIIDGYALFHRLCFDSNVDLRHGGDYDSFTDVTQRFFESLFACKVHPYVVLDGGCDVSDKKFLTLKDRAREKIQVAHSLSVGGRGNLLPLLIREVFIQVLNKLHVDFVQCFSEADRDIMTLANHWNCPVLTMDSDFCIFDLKAGFCPLNGFQWKNLTVIKDTLHCYIPARCFSVDKFCSHFNNMNKTLLPLFAVLCGNDYISLPALDTVLNRMSFTPGTSNMKGRKHQRILGLLNWLSNFDDPPEALNTFVKYLKMNDRDVVRELLCGSMEEYQPSPVKLQEFFQLGAYVSPCATNLGLPEWIQLALAKGQLSPFVCDALSLRRTILHTQVENLRRPSAHIVSVSIRKVIYGLLQNFSPDLNNVSQSTVSKQPMAFSEVERIDKNIGTVVTHAVRLSEEYRELGRLTELSLSKRKILLLETLKVKEGILDPIPASLKLPIAVTCFWLQSLEAKVKRYHVQALLMGMLCGQLHKMTSEPDNEGLHVDGAKLLCDQFLKVKENKLQRKLNLDTAHVFCQWQCCLQMGFYLNQLLLTPLPEPDLTWLYSGTLVHGLSQELSTSSSAESILSVCPRARQLYNQLFHALKSAVPSECLSQREKLKAKKKKQRKNDASQTKYRVGVSLGTRSLCDHVSNSFGLLTVDDSED